MRLRLNYGCLLITVLLSSCSFNKQFFKPVKLSSTTRLVRVKDQDSRAVTTIQFSGDNHQPIFSAVLQNSGHELSITSVVFTNNNGTSLNGWMIKSLSTKKAVYTVLHLHGNEGALITQYKAIIPLVKPGVQVFMFDYSGYGFSAGIPTQQSVLGDALSALNYVKSRDDVKNTDIVLYGQSIGAHLAAVVASKCEENIQCLVMEGSFSTMKDIAAYRLRKYTGLGFPARILVRSQYNAVEAIKNYHKPLLIIHSSEDKEVPYYMSTVLYTLANDPKTFFKITGPHIYGAILFPDSILSRIKRMTNK